MKFNCLGREMYLKALSKMIFANVFLFAFICSADEVRQLNCIHLFKINSINLIDYYQDLKKIQFFQTHPNVTGALTEFKFDFQTAHHNDDFPGIMGAHVEVNFISKQLELNNRIHLLRHGTSVSADYLINNEMLVELKSLKLKRFLDHGGQVNQKYYDDMSSAIQRQLSKAVNQLNTSKANSYSRGFYLRKSEQLKYKKSALIIYFVINAKHTDLGDIDIFKQYLARISEPYLKNETDLMGIVFEVVSLPNTFYYKLLHENYRDDLHANQKINQLLIKRNLNF